MAKIYKKYRSDTNEYYYANSSQELYSYLKLLIILYNDARKNRENYLKFKKENNRHQMSVYRALCLNNKEIIEEIKKELTKED